MPEEWIILPAEMIESFRRRFDWAGDRSRIRTEHLMASFAREGRSSDIVE